MAKTQTKLYSDIDLTFTKNPVTGDVSISYDSQAIIRSIRNLLLTNFYERLFQPNLGSNINAHLFELTNAISASSIETEIKNVIENFEPRARITDIKVIAMEDQNAYYIEVAFFIGNNTTPTTINLLLERSR
jgi:phage baseplate assembly protein W